MFLNNIIIDQTTTASEIVNQDYRTAEVFRQYGIGYCCSGRWPLDAVCREKEIELDKLIEDLNRATRTIQLSINPGFENWSIDFLTDYVINIHHYYLIVTLPGLKELLVQFIKEHKNKYPQYDEVHDCYMRLEEELLPHIKQEEETIFPYLRQVAHAYENKDSFARLLVRTLRKPIARIIEQEHELLSTTIYRIRKLTNNYTPPAQACPSHKVVLSKLKELDNDLIQHVYLENEILFPKIIAMEKELLNQP